ncbi:MAG TPA: LysE family translocator [Oligoflexia bacterium]|nr:LysE family translocator [Oligoflexia bacterium]
MTASVIIYFLGASAALTIAPGPDNIFIISQGIAHGRKAAVITAWGMCSGISVHTACAAFGLSAVFYSSALAFQAVQFAGAGYLLYLAYKTLHEPSFFPSQTSSAKWSAASLFRRGFLMNVLNPKVALFFLAFLPQFAAPSSPVFVWEMLFLGVVFMLQAIFIFSIIGYFSGSVGDYLAQNAAAGKFMSWLTAGVFISLAIRLALARR